MTFATKRDFAEALTKTSLGLPGTSAAGSRGPGGSPTPGSPPGSPRLPAARRSTRPRPVGAGVADEEVRRLAHPCPSAHNPLLSRRSTTRGKAAGDSTHVGPTVGLTNVKLWLEFCSNLGVSATLAMELRGSGARCPALDGECSGSACSGVGARPPWRILSTSIRGVIVAFGLNVRVDRLCSYWVTGRVV